MVVYICCAGGATSSMFCSKIKEAADEGKVYFDDIASVAKKYISGELNDVDLVLAYGPADAVNEVFVKEHNFDKVFDLVLVSPQARYCLRNIRKALDPLGIPSDTIDMRVFGTMNGEKGLEIINSYR